MRTLRNILGFGASSAFLFASVLNSQLVYNAEMFNNEPAKFDARLVDMHTGLVEGVPVFYKAAKDRNRTELTRFFQSIK